MRPVRTTKFHKELIEQKKKKQLIKEATRHKAKASGMIELLKNDPDYAMTVAVGGIEMGLCDNDAFIKMLESEIAEANKAITGQPNKFE